MTLHVRSIGRRAAVALAALALVSLLAVTGWAVAEMEGAEAPVEAAEEAAMSAPPATAAVAEEVAVPAPTGKVSRSAFTSQIADREPVDQITALDNDATRIIFFSELMGLEGQTVVHRWEHNGEVLAEVPFEVRGPRWRVYSRKSLDPTWLGEWAVRVIDGAGNELSFDSFTYSEAESAPAPPSSLEAD
jgi:hypothetical protein